MRFIDVLRHHDFQVVRVLLHYLGLDHFCLNLFLDHLFYRGGHSGSRPVIHFFWRNDVFLFQFLYIDFGIRLDYLAVFVRNKLRSFVVVCFGRLVLVYKFIQIRNELAAEIGHVVCKVLQLVQDVIVDTVLQLGFIFDKSTALNVAAFNLGLGHLAISSFFVCDDIDHLDPAKGRACVG